MSTLTTLRAHEDAVPPRLKRFLPMFVGHEREIRHVTMTVAIHKWLYEPTKSKQIQDVKSVARTHFGEFVKENKVNDLYFMKQVEDRRVPARQKFQHGVWSFRPLGEPQHRFFGVFACTDWFLVFNKQLRQNLRTDTAWHAQVDTALRTWAKLFPGFRVYTGTQIEHYISRNVEHCDERWY